MRARRACSELLSIHATLPLPSWSSVRGILRPCPTLVPLRPDCVPLELNAELARDSLDECGLTHAPAHAWLCRRGQRHGAEADSKSWPNPPLTRRLHPQPHPFLLPPPLSLCPPLRLWPRWISRRRLPSTAHVWFTSDFVDPISYGIVSRVAARLHLCVCADRADATGYRILKSLHARHEIVQPTKEKLCVWCGCVTCVCVGLHAVIHSIRRHRLRAHLSDQTLERSEE